MRREAAEALETGTLAAVWADFADVALAGWPVDARRTMRRAFYAGAAGAVALLDRLGRGDRTLNQMADAVGDLRAEMARFVDDARAGRA